MNKVKVLFLAASPDGAGTLKLDEEIRSITHKILTAESRDIELISAWAVRPDDLLQTLNQHKPNIVHFSGHGSPSGEIILVDENLVNGRQVPKPVSPKAIKALFQVLKDNVQVVVLNACFSRIQAEAIKDVIDCVIGMNAAIGDKAAITFAASFYRALGFGRSVKEAFEQGKVALLLEGIPGETIPELLVKTGVEPSNVFLIKIVTESGQHLSYPITSLPYGLKSHEQSSRTDTPPKLTEAQYLITLIADLKKLDGVSQYVDLAASTNKLPDDEWGYAKLFKSQKISLRSIREVFEKFQSFVLLGEPGAGKTTTLRRFALEIAQKRLESQAVPIPLFVHLSKWRDEPTPLDFVCTEWPLSGDVGNLLKTGNIMLFMDGLNEMGADGARKGELLKKWFESPDAPKRIVLTCRAANYTDDLQFKDLSVVLLKELDYEKILQLSKYYINKDLDTFLDHMVPKNYSSSQNDRIFERLARNPYMLRAMIHIYEFSPSEHLPRNSGALFHRLIQALWSREEKRATIGNIPFNDVYDALATLAFKIVDEDKPTEIPEKYAIRKIAYALALWANEKNDETISQLPKLTVEAVRYTKDLLKVGKNASFIEICDERVNFYHQLILEYFAASYMLITGEVNFPVLHINPITTDWRPSRWHQVIIALAGILADEEYEMDEFVTQCADAHPYLAADCIASGIQVSSEIRKMLVSALSEILHIQSTGGLGVDFVKHSIIEFGVVPHFVDKYVETVRQIANADCIPVLLEVLYQGDLMLTFAAGRALGAMGKRAIQDLCNVLTDRVSDDNWWFASVAAHGLEVIDDPECVSDIARLLSSNVSTGSTKGTRMGGITTIGRIAEETLERIGTEEALQALRKWREAG